MDFMKMKKKDIRALDIPTLDCLSEATNVYSIIIIPTTKKHDSGFSCMEFILINKNGEPVYRTFGGSDVINIDGIGGYGDWNPDHGVPKSIKPVGWSIDCLPCGYLRLWCNKPIKCAGISTFEVWANREEK